MLLIFFQFYLATAPFREGYYWTTKIHSANCELKSGKYLNEEFFATNSALADVSNSEELWTFNLLHHSRHSPSSVTTYLNTKKSKKIYFASDVYDRKHVMLEKKWTDFCAKEKPLFWLCSWMIDFHKRRTKKSVFIISDTDRD